MQSQDRFPMLPVITGLFVCTLVLIPSTASKFIAIGPLNIVGATLIFPLSFIFNDILTEVYGYERARRIIWIGFFAQAFAALMYWLIQIWPPAPFWQNQAAYDIILGQSWRIVLASLSAYFCSEFVNSYILSKMKYAQGGRRGWSQGWRFAVSTFFGQLVDSIVFMTVAFAGVLTTGQIISTIISIWLFKSAYEVLVIPLSTRFANWVKSREGVDVTDDPANTNYSPFPVR